MLYYLYKQNKVKDKEEQTKMSYTDDPVIDAEEYYSRNDKRSIIGICESCGNIIHGQTDDEYGEDYVKIPDGIVHWDCWDDYGRSLMVKNSI